MIIYVHIRYHWIIIKNTKENRAGKFYNKFMKNLVLASGSQYRQALMKQLGLEFTAESPEIDESALTDESPEQIALRLSTGKAKSLTWKYPDHIIIGSDQVAMLNNRQLTKPGNRRNCISQLRSVSGKRVIFYTGLCVLDSKTGRFITEVDVCSVDFRTLTDTQIERYVDRDQPFDCAGGFKSESLGIALIKRITGNDPNALIGLPLIKLTEILNQFGCSVL